MSRSVPLAAPLAVPLSVAMREGSRAEHESAEASPFLTDLLAGRVPPSRYAGYLARLRVVYAALESTGRAHREDPWVAAVHDPALDRLDAIDADLAHWGDPGPVESPAAAEHARRIRDASGPAYVAHHYTRYLGDLSGGQAIGRTLDQLLGPGGTRFFAFDVGRVKPYKDAYRARLDALGATPAEVDLVVQEVRLAFRLTQALLAESTP